MNKTVDRASTASASKSVRRPTLSSSRGRSARISVRLPVGVYGVLKESVPNVSSFIRELTFDALERLPVVFEFEEYRLEVEVARINGELEKVHRWQRLLLKHGSYAQAYLEKLKGGIVVDRSPFYVREPPPSVKPEELVTVSDIVKYREKLAKQLVGLLNRLMALKLSKSRDKQTTEKEVKKHGRKRS